MYFFILDTLLFLFFFFFFFNDTATTEIYTLSLHDALPISRHVRWNKFPQILRPRLWIQQSIAHEIDQLVKLHRDRKSTRLNSSHANISYAVFCLKKKKKKKKKELKNETIK